MGTILKDPGVLAEPHPIYQRVGEITRQLHDALRELGYDKQLEASLGRLPDARSRLSFIAQLTGEAAEKVLNTVDAAQARQALILSEVQRVEDLLQAGMLPPGAMSAFAGFVKENAEATHTQLTDIMMAQDFHDLTGQTVRKVVDVAAGLEEALLKLLMETSFPQPDAPREMLDGPVSDSASRTDVVTNQAQVDDLLESLGF